MCLVSERSYHGVYSYNYCSNYQNDGWANFYPHANYYTVTYSTVVCGHVSTQVIAVGQIGVWRLTHLDYTSSDSDVLEDIAKQDHAFQPEMENFAITEICKGIHI